MPTPEVILELFTVLSSKSKRLFCPSDWCFLQSDSLAFWNVPCLLKLPPIPCPLRHFLFLLLPSLITLRLFFWKFSASIHNGNRSSLSFCTLHVPRSSLPGSCIVLPPGALSNAIPSVLHLGQCPSLGWTSSKGLGRQLGAIDHTLSSSSLDLHNNHDERLSFHVGGLHCLVKAVCEEGRVRRY